MTRRSKRKSLVAIRCSARQQARQQQDAEIYGSDYGILPSGACVRLRVSVGVGFSRVFGFRSCLACCHISLLSHLIHGRLIHGESLRDSRAVRNVVSRYVVLLSNLDVLRRYSLTTLLTLLFTILYYYATYNYNYNTTMLR